MSSEFQKVKTFQKLFLENSNNSIPPFRGDELEFWKYRKTIFRKVSYWKNLFFTKNCMTDFTPTILIDSREQAPLVFSRYPAITGTLQSGDYSFRGGEDLFSIERKSLDDLAQCCTGDQRERFSRELHRLRGFWFKRLLVIGCRSDIERHNYKSAISPAAVLGTLSTFEVRFDCPVVFAPDPMAAALMIERWVHYAAREFLKISQTISESAPALVGSAKS